MTTPACEGFPLAKVIHFHDICKDPDDFNISINENKKKPIGNNQRTFIKIL